MEKAPTPAPTSPTSTTPDAGTLEWLEYHGDDDIADAIRELAEYYGQHEKVVAAVLWALGANKD